MFNFFKSKNKQSQHNIGDIINKSLKQDTNNNGNVPNAVKHTNSKQPTLNQFLLKRDWIGALTYIEHTLQIHNNTISNHIDYINTTIQLKQQLAWITYHTADYERCIQLYTELLYHTPTHTYYNLYIACCLYYMTQYKLAYDTAKKYTSKNTNLSTNDIESYNSLQIRILFHLSHKLNDESGVTRYHSLLSPTSIIDQLSLAAMHYIRYHYQEATDLYKSLLLQNRSYIAIQVYVALCYYKLDYYDVSLELLMPYIAQYPDSAIGINLKACNTYKLYDGVQAEAELKSIVDSLTQQSITTTYESDLINHNLVVFRHGYNALQIWSALTDTIPEAKLNLILYYLHEQDYNTAYSTIESLECTTPAEYIIKAIVYTIKGQNDNNHNYITNAQQQYQLVGASSSECDTIPGRQCMASYYYLDKQYDSVLIYLSSIKQYTQHTVEYQWNYALTVAQCTPPNWIECNLALIELQSCVDSTRIINELCYLQWLCKSYIYTGQSDHAWNVYDTLQSNDPHIQHSLLLLLGNECYATGQFYISAKSFDRLEQLDMNNSTQYWDGKRGAICGVLQLVCAGKIDKHVLIDCINMLHSNTATPQAEFISRILQKYCQENGIRL